MTDKHYILIMNLMFLTVCYSSNLTQSCFNIFVYRTFNKKLSIDDIKKYFKEDHFTFLVVETNELFFGFDLSKAAEVDIAVKLVTQSFPGVGIDGKNVYDIVVGWKLTRLLPTWMKESNC